MDTALVVVIMLLAGVFAMGFYRDWYGLWVSKKEMSEEIAMSAARRAPVKRS
jgi:hypothetical protein